MKLVPLRPVSPTSLSDGSLTAAASCRVTCLLTGARSPDWNDAASAGWVLDADGEPFSSYYSPAAALTLSADEAARLAELARGNRLYSSP